MHVWRKVGWGVLAAGGVAGAIYGLTHGWRWGLGPELDGLGGVGGVAAEASGSGGRAVVTYAVLAAWLGFPGLIWVPHLRRWVWLVTLLVTLVACVLWGGGWLVVGAAVGVAMLLDMGPGVAPAPAAAAGGDRSGPTGAGVPVLRRALRAVSRLGQARAAGGRRRPIPLLAAGRGSESGRCSSRRSGRGCPTRSWCGHLPVPGGAEVLVKGRAVRHLLRGLGGGWRLLGACLAMLPTRVLDWGYDWVARRRKRWFGEPPDACPLVPAAYRGRLLP